MDEDKSIDAENRLATWETPMLTTLEASDAEAGALVTGDAAVPGNLIS